MKPLLNMARHRMARVAIPVLSVCISVYPWPFPAFAQVQLEGIRQGHVLDESAQSLRPVIGTPGSAYLGPPIALPFPIRSATTRGRRAIVVSTENKAYLIPDLTLTNPQTTELAPAEAAYLDDTGLTALLVNQQRLAFASDTATHPAIDTARIPSAITFLQNQSCAIIASKDGINTLLHRYCADRPAELPLLRTIDNLTASALAHASDAGLYIMDREAGRITLIRNPIEAGAIETVVEALDNPTGIVSISTTAAMAAVAGSAKALILSPTEPPVSIDLPATPDRLETLLPNRILACSGIKDQPLLVIDLLQDRTPFFIPVLRGAQ